MFKAFFSELIDEAEDFFEDIFEHVRRHPRVDRPTKTREVMLGGVVATVRPAYLFAERLDNLLKIVFGISIILSALTATFLGYGTMSELLKALITSVPGRILMFFIGVSYFLTALWKLLHIKVGQKS